MNRAPKKITMALTNDVIRDARVLREATTLVKNGFIVTIVGIKSEKTPYEEIWDCIHIKRIDPAPWKGTFRDTIGTVTRYMRHVFTYGNLTQKYLYDTLITVPTDIYHSHDFNTLLPVVKAAQHRKVPYVYDSHELFVDTLNEIPTRGWHERAFMKIVRLYCKIMERKYIRKAAYVITVNQQISDELSKRYSIPKPIVLRNIPLLKHIEQKKNWHSIFNIPSDSKIILYQGVIGTSRGVLQLINAMTHLPDNYHLVFLGYGSFVHKIEPTAQKLNINDRIHYHPAVALDVLLKYTAGADCGVSLIEPNNLSKQFALPNKLFEYMMAGLPIVCSDLPAMREVIQTAHNGSLTKNLEPNVIAQTIQKTLEQMDTEQLKNNSLQSAREIFNWEKESKKLLALYKTL